VYVGVKVFWRAGRHDRLHLMFVRADLSRIAFDGGGVAVYVLAIAFALASPRTAEHAPDGERGVETSGP
jgi:hypothetical protein